MSVFMNAYTLTSSPSFGRVTPVLLAILLGIAASIVTSVTVTSSDGSPHTKSPIKLTTTQVRQS